MKKTNDKNYSVALSVIIPVYCPNELLFLNLMNSIANQTFNDYEVIIIDDGNDYKYKKLLNAQKQKYKYCKIVSQKNAGVSNARNVGIMLSRGEYIIFVDSDDYLAPRFFELAYKIVKIHDADVLYGDIKPTSKLNEKFIFEDFSKILVENSEVKNAIDSLYGCTNRKIPYKISGSPCGNIYRKNIVKEVNFNSEIKYFEDQLFNRRILSVARRIIIYPEKWYFYYKNDSSAMNSQKRDVDIEKNFNCLLDEYSRINRKENDDIINSYKIYLIHLYWGMLTLAYRKSCKNKNECINIMKTVLQRTEYEELKCKTPHNMSVKDRIMRLAIKYTNIKTQLFVLMLFRKI